VGEGIFMTTILLVVLFISQLLTFYFLVILNSKLSKYKEIEKKQEAIIRDMDDAISAYLVEVKDENDRLIKELTMQSKMKKTVQSEQQKSTEYSNQQVDRKTTVLSKDDVLEDSAVKGQKLKLEPKENIHEQVFDVPKIVSKTIAATAYKKQSSHTQLPVEQPEIVAEPTEKLVDQKLSQFEKEVVGYHRLGMSIDEIAKKTQKGKKEIELLIKFHA